MADVPGSEHQPQHAGQRRVMENHTHLDRYTRGKEVTFSVSTAEDRSPRSNPVRTYTLTHQWKVDLVDASSKNCECESSVEEEVEEDVPALPVDADHTVIESVVMNKSMLMLSV